MVQGVPNTQHREEIRTWYFTPAVVLALLCNHNQMYQFA